MADSGFESNPGFESDSRASWHGEELIYCTRFKCQVIEPICYQCQYWDGVRGRCDAGDLYQPLRSSRQIDVPISFNEALSATKGATEEDFKREHRLVARKVA